MTICMLCASVDVTRPRGVNVSLFNIFCLFFVMYSILVMKLLLEWLLNSDCDASEPR